MSKSLNGIIQILQLAVRGQDNNVLLGLNSQLFEDQLKITQKLLCILISLIRYCEAYFLH